MNNSIECYTVICRFHSGIDACDPWSEFSVLVKGVRTASQAALAACDRLVSDNGGRAEASMVISGAPDLYFPRGAAVDSEDERAVFLEDRSDISYLELN